MSEQSIVGGTADSSDPAVVAINIESTGLAVCSGTLIAPGVVLAAGHCPTEPVWIRQGSDVSDLGWSDHVEVDTVVKHPKYTGEGKPFDLALFKLHRGLDGVAPIPLSASPLGPGDVGASIRHVGFGTTGDDWDYVAQIGTGSVKRQVTYPITKVDDDFLYSGAPGKQTCLFDSGGPALRVSGGTEMLIGVVSGGDDCHSDGWDTRVDRPDVLSWIDQQLATWGTMRP
jgi:secreted trypsin-like serine protease